MTADPDRVALAVAAYARRYRQPGENRERVAIVDAIEITVERMLGRA